MPKRPVPPHVPRHDGEADAAVYRPVPPSRQQQQFSKTPIDILMRTMREQWSGGDKTEAVRLALVLLPYRHSTRGRAAPVRKDTPDLGERRSHADADLAEAIAAARRGSPR